MSPLSQLILASVLYSTATLCQQYQFSEEFGIGGGSGAGASGLDEAFEESARNPLLHNNYSFPGFDFSITPSVDQRDYRLSSNWTLQLNYSAIDVTNRTISPDRNVTQLVSLVQYDLVFPDGEALPLQNDTDWTMCGYLLTSPFPSKHRSRFGQEDGSCRASLGDKCFEAYRDHVLRSALTGNRCLTDVLWSGLDECSDLEGDITVGSTSLMNHTYVPLQDRGNYTTTPWYGLNSTQSIFYQVSDNYNESQIADYVQEYGSEMRMLILSWVPSEAFTAAQDPNVGQSVLQRDVQIICGTVDSTPDFEAAAPKLFTTTGLWVLTGMVALQLLL